MSEFSHDLAVVIGINQYGGGIAPLQTAVNDVQELARILQDDHGYQVVQLVDQQATLKALQHLLDEELPKSIQANGRLLFYFAGHGIALNGDEGPEGYLIPQDAKSGDISSYLSMPKLQAALSELPCRHFLGILDCCFAGAFRWSSTRDLLSVPEVIHKERYDRFIQDPAWQTITSAASDQKALDSLTINSERGQSGNHSPFAAALIDALVGKADVYPPAKNGKPGGDGVITATELYLYLRDAVEPATEGNRQRQTPGIWPLKKHDKGEYIFLAPGHVLNLPPAPPLDESRNPYRGLQSFEAEQSDLFFGRASLTAKLSEFVSQQPLTVVLGASGSGKSSLVKAGLIPELEQQDAKADQPQWKILAPMRPGESPFKALSNALTEENTSEFSIPEAGSASETEMLTQYMAAWNQQHPGLKVLLAIDQFEELITLCRDEKEREQFLSGLAQAVTAYPEQLRLVLTLRSDFEPQFQEGLLKEHWGTARFVVPPMTRSELREAIEEPASKRVMYFQSDDPKNPLVDQLINEVAEMPGALPLLSFTLSELYLKYLQRQKTAQDRGDSIDRAITEADYQELGGVARSLTQRADQEYEALVQQDKAYEQTIRYVMLRMVAVGSGELARRRVPLSEFEYPPTQNDRVKEVIRRFSAARLVVEGQDPDGKPYAEPAHDALVRGWKRLKAWMQKDEENLLLQRRLTPAAEEWGSQQKARFLWNANPRLDLLKKVLNSEDNWLNNVEAEFVSRSVSKKRNNTLVRWSIAGSVLLGSVIFSGAIWLQLQQTDLREKAARARSLLDTNEPVDGLVLAIQATGQNIALTKVPFQQMLAPVQSSLFEAINTSRESNSLQVPIGVDCRAGGQSCFRDIHVSQNGKSIVINSADGTIRKWNIQEDSVETQPPGVDDQGELSSTIKNWNSSNNTTAKNKTFDFKSIAPKLQLKLGDLWRIDDFSFSPDGKLITQNGAHTAEKIAYLSDLQGNLVNPFNEPQESIHSFNFSPDNRFIVSDSFDGTLRLSSRQDDQYDKLAVLRGHSSQIESILFSPGSNYLISASSDKTIRIWDLTNQALAQRILFDYKKENLLDYSSKITPDGKYVVINGQFFDKQKNLVNPTDFQKDLDDHYLIGSDGINFLPDFKNEKSNSSTGEVIAVSSGRQYYVSKNYDNGSNKGGLIQIFDYKGEKTGEVKTEAQATVATFTRSGAHILIGYQDGKLLLFDKQGKLLKTFLGHRGAINAVNLSQDDQSFVSASDDTTGRLWSLNDERKVTVFEGHKEAVNTIVFSPDGQYIATGSGSRAVALTSETVLSRDNTIILWDLQGNQISRPFEGHDKRVTSIAFTPDGQSMISGSSESNAVLVWQIGNWKTWLSVACNRLRYHRVLKNPTNDTEKAAKETCEKYVWNNVGNSQSSESASISTLASTSQVSSTTPSVPPLPCNESLPPALPSKEPGYYILNGTQYRYYGSLEEKVPPDGQVTQLFRSGNQYDGEFKDGKRSGCGIFTYNNGQRYIGQFANDQYAGIGKLTWKRGDSYQGEFLDGKCHGQGTLTLSDGTFKTGTWRNGSLDGEPNVSCDRE